MWSVKYTPLELENIKDAWCSLSDCAENRDVVHADQKLAIPFSS